MIALRMANVGTITAIWRYPVKSMTGEELDASAVTEQGVLGDRAYALIDAETGKVASAKNPKRWPNLFQCHAAFTEPPETARELPPVRVTRLEIPGAGSYPCVGVYATVAAGGNVSRGDPVALE
jgi:MOSC N-terminal beta barrel domain